MLGFSTATWKLAPRDNFIGWTPELREKNLPLVVDTPRFLILPWVEIHNLGSHILAIVRRRLPQDWTERYNITPVLIETFVETPRYTGAVYRDRAGSMSGPPKDAGATTGKSSTTNPARMSGSGPSDAAPPTRLAKNSQSLILSPSPYSFAQRVMERSVSATDVTVAPVQQGSFRTLNCICTDSHPMTERKPLSTARSKDYRQMKPGTVRNAHKSDCGLLPQADGYSHPVCARRQKSIV